MATDNVFFGAGFQSIADIDRLIDTLVAHGSLPDCEKCRGHHRRELLIHANGDAGAQVLAGELFTYEYHCGVKITFMLKLVDAILGMWQLHNLPHNVQMIKPETVYDLIQQQVERGNIDLDHARHLPVDNPVMRTAIMAEIPNLDHEPNVPADSMPSIIIDGQHRVARATLDDEMFVAIILPWQEARLAVICVESTPEQDAELKQYWKDENNG